MNLLRSIVTRLLPTAWMSPYEAANPSPRRGRVPGAAPRDAKLDLLPGVRRELARLYPQAAADLLGPKLRACVDDAIVPDDADLGGAREVAFFPPLSGG